MRYNNWILWTAIAVLFFAHSVNAQPGLSEFREVSGEIRGWYFNFSDLSLVLGAICGLLGGVRIYYNWQSGKHHHIDSQVMAWFLSCLFLSLLSATLTALFGIH